MTLICLFCFSSTITQQVTAATSRKVRNAEDHTGKQRVCLLAVAGKTMGCICALPRGPVYPRYLGSNRGIPESPGLPSQNTIPKTSQETLRSLDHPCTPSSAGLVGILSPLWGPKAAPLYRIIYWTPHGFAYDGIQDSHGYILNLDLD